MLLPNAAPPLQRVSNENSAPSLCGWSASQREAQASLAAACLSIFWPSFFPSLPCSLALLLHQFGNSWSVVFLPNGPR